jgi:hypothetical protein
VKIEVKQVLEPIELLFEPAAEVALQRRIQPRERLALRDEATTAEPSREVDDRLETLPPECAPEPHREI